MTTVLVLLAGAVLLAASGAVHLRLWAEGYRHIPTIGPLFLLQGVTAVVVAVAVVGSRRLLVALAALVLAVATIAGFLLSVGVGLLGFQDTWAAPYAGLAFSLELAASVVLAAGAVLLVRRSPAHRAGGRPRVQRTAANRSSPGPPAGEGADPVPPGAAT